jgi:hypothetical protein
MSYLTKILSGPVFGDAARNPRWASQAEFDHTARVSEIAITNIKG